MQKTNTLKSFYLVSIIIIVCSIIQMFSPESTELLRYQNKEVSNGEWWRLISANFTHSNWNHLMLNMTGLVLVDYLFQPFVPVKTRFYLLTFCMFLNVLLIHLLLTMYWYVGLSGALHGYLLGGALLSINQAKKFSYVVILFVSLKLFIELNWEVNQLTSTAINANVVEEAHFFGAISAICFYFLFQLLHFILIKKDA